MRNVKTPLTARRVHKYETINQDLEIAEELSSEVEAMKPFNPFAHRAMFCNAIQGLNSSSILLLSFNVVIIFMMRDLFNQLGFKIFEIERIFLVFIFVVVEIVSTATAALYCTVVTRQGWWAWLWLAIAPAGICALLGLIKLVILLGSEASGYSIQVYEQLGLSYPAADWYLGTWSMRMFLIGIAHFLVEAFCFIALVLTVNDYKSHISRHNAHHDSVQSSSSHPHIVHSLITSLQRSDRERFVPHLVNGKISLIVEVMVLLALLWYYRQQRIFGADYGIYTAKLWWVDWFFWLFQAVCPPVIVSATGALWIQMHVSAVKFQLVYPIIVFQRIACGCCCVVGLGSLIFCSVMRFSFWRQHEELDIPLLVCDWIYQWTFISTMITVFGVFLFSLLIEINSNAVRRRHMSFLNRDTIRMRSIFNRLYETHHACKFANMEICSACKVHTDVDRYLDYVSLCLMSDDWELDQIAKCVITL